MEYHFSFEGRTERLISSGRIVLAFFSLIAVWLDPTTPPRYASVAYPLLIGYVAYALIVAFIVWTPRGPLTRIRVVTHICDLVMFSLFIYFIEGPTSPFFAYFVFAILCATLRWQWRGALWTAIATLVTFVGIGFYASKILQDPAFEVDRFIIRAVYLAVVGVLLGYLGMYESQRRGQLAQLAAWSRTPHLELEKVASQVLGQAAAILKTPRIVLLWEEPEEPWLHLVLFSRGRLEWSREPPGRFPWIVAAPLEGKSFFSQNVRGATAVIVHASSSAVQRWYGEPLNRDLVSRLNMENVLAVNLLGENLRGWMFFLDKASVTADEIILAEVVAGQAAASMDLFYFMQQLQQMAAKDERMRLAHDLHDGVLQSLTATGLGLQAALQVLDANPGAVRQQLRQIQDLIFQEQRDLRSFVEELKLATLAPAESEVKVRQILADMAKRVERQWGLRVEIQIAGAEAPLPAALGREIYHLVREGLVNAGRHSHGSMARAEVEIEERRVRISVWDNGVGFPFHGHYDHAALTATGLGPAMLKSRIASLAGSLSIQSSQSGARLDISLPLSKGEA
jgi:signal transduction histidine kinase